MKVLHVTNAMPIEGHPGFGIFIKEQIDAIAAEGVECDVIFINARVKGKTEYIRDVSRILKQGRSCDLIHCHHTFTALVVHLFCRLDLPIVTSFLCPRGKEGRNGHLEWLKGLFHDYVLKKSTCFIQKDDPGCESLYPQKGYYIPNGIDLVRFSPMPAQQAWVRLGLPPGKYVLFCSAGRLDRSEKRYDKFLKVMQILQETVDPTFKALLLVVERRSRVPLYFNAASVHLLTSDFEGSPNSVKEALACNLPVVSTDVGNVHRMLGDVGGCYVSSSSEPDELAGLVSRAVAHGPTNGRHWLRRQGLGQRETVRQILSVYKAAIWRYKRKQYPPKTNFHLAD